MTRLGATILLTMFLTSAHVGTLLTQTGQHRNCHTGTHCPHKEFRHDEHRQKYEFSAPSHLSFKTVASAQIALTRYEPNWFGVVGGVFCCLVCVVVPCSFAWLVSP